MGTSPRRLPSSTARTALVTREMFHPTPPGTHSRDRDDPLLTELSYIHQRNFSGAKPVQTRHDLLKSGRRPRRGPRVQGGLRAPGPDSTLTTTSVSTSGHFPSSLVPAVLPPSVHRRVAPRPSSYRPGPSRRTFCQYRETPFLSPLSPCHTPTRVSSPTRVYQNDPSPFRHPPRS